MSLPLICTSVTCPKRETCSWGQWKYLFREIKAANVAGRSRDCHQPGEVCPRMLHQALHSMERATERWAKRITSGLSDADLSDAIGYEFGEWHQRSTGPGYTAMRHPPRIWFGRQVGEDGKRRKPDLQGKELLEAVRELLSVPLPVQAQPVAPWAALPMFNARG